MPDVKKRLADMGGTVVPYGRQKFEGYILSEIVRQLAGVTFNIIHYKGVTGSLKDVVACQIDVAFVNANSARAPMTAAEHLVIRHLTSELNT